MFYVSGHNAHCSKCNELYHSRGHLDKEGIEVAEAKPATIKVLRLTMLIDVIKRA